MLLISFLPESEDSVATPIIYDPYMTHGLSGKVLIISEDIELLHIYYVLLLQHGKRKF